MRSTYPPQTGYPPQQQTGYPPQQQTGYPPPMTQTGYPPKTGYRQPQQTGYPPPMTQTGYPPQQTGYPPQQQTGYPPQTGYRQPQQTGYPPQQQQPQGNFWYSQYYQQIAGNPQAFAALQQWFNSVDQDRSGTINANEIANIRFAGQPLGLEVATKLIKVFDKDQSGSIEFVEYAILHQFLNVIQNAFFTADANRSGTIDAREIYTALQTAGFTLNFNTVQAAVTKFDTSKTGLNFQQFLLLCSHLSHLRSIFDWNDAQRSGRISLSYDQLCLIGTDILLK